MLSSIEKFSIQVSQYIKQTLDNAWKGDNFALPKTNIRSGDEFEWKAYRNLSLDMAHQMTTMIVVVVAEIAVAATNPTMLGNRSATNRTETARNGSECRVMADRHRSFQYC